MVSDITQLVPDSSGMETKYLNSADYALDVANNAKQAEDIRKKTEDGYTDEEGVFHPGRVQNEEERKASEAKRVEDFANMEKEFQLCEGASEEDREVFYLSLNADPEKHYIERCDDSDFEGYFKWKWVAGQYVIYVYTSSYMPSDGDAVYRVNGDSEEIDVEHPTGTFHVTSRWDYYDNEEAKRNRKFDEKEALRQGKFDTNEGESNHVVYHSNVQIGDVSKSVILGLNGTETIYGEQMYKWGGKDGVDYYTTASKPIEPNDVVYTFVEGALQNVGALMIETSRWGIFNTYETDRNARANKTINDMRQALTEAYNQKAVELQTDYENTKQELARDYESKSSEIATDYAAAKSKLAEDYSGVKGSLDSDYQNAKLALEEDFLQKIKDLNSSFDSKAKELNDDFKKKTELLDGAYQKAIKSLNSRMSEIENNYSQSKGLWQKDIDDMLAKFEEDFDAQEERRQEAMATIEQEAQKLNDLSQELNKLFISDFLVEQGGINVYGNEIDAQNRIRTSRIYGNKSIDTGDDNIRILIVAYYSITTDKFVRVDTPSTRKWNIGYEGCYARLALKKADDSEIHPYNIKSITAIEELNKKVNETVDLSKTNAEGVSKCVKSNSKDLLFEIGYIHNTSSENVGTKEPNQGFATIKKTCRAGDVYTITGNGGAGARLWAFADSNGSIITRANSNESANKLFIKAPTDGFIVLNCSLSYAYSARMNVDGPRNTLSAVLLEAGGINYAGDNTNDGNKLYYRTKGHINGKSGVISIPDGYTFRIVCWYDLRGKFVNYEFIYNKPYCVNEYAMLSKYQYRFVVQKGTGTPTENVNLADFDLSVDFRDTMDGVYSMKHNPTYFEHIKELDDVSEIVSAINPKGQKSTIIERVYAGFDDLVSNYGNMISKSDVVETLGMSYPSYARLNGQSSGNYLATPSYNTYMYKIAINGIPKRKMLIVGGLHGLEYTSPMNLYIFAWKLCNIHSLNMYTLLNMYDVYIIPCLNGYGMYHELRRNANNIDLNRNFPTNYWKKDDSIATGDIAGSEFETQLMMAVINDINPDIMIDHHAYDVAQTNHLYAGANPDKKAIIKQVFNECAFAFAKSLPQYFDNENHSYLKTTSSNSMQAITEGMLSKWADEEKCKYSSYVEIGSTILFQNGVYNPDLSTTFSNDVFSIADTTLMEHLIYAIEFVE